MSKTGKLYSGVITCACGVPLDARGYCTNKWWLNPHQEEYKEIRHVVEEKRTETSINPKDLIGAKKLSLTVLPDVAVAHANHAMQDGARKYKAYNWRSKDVGVTTYINAARRHLAQWYDGQETASDSGVHHLGHAIACLAILLDAQESGNLIDDRPQNSGGFNRLLERLNASCSGS